MLLSSCKNETVLFNRTSSECKTTSLKETEGDGVLIEKELQARGKSRRCFLRGPGGQVIESRCVLSENGDTETRRKSQWWVDAMRLIEISVENA